MPGGRGPEPPQRSNDRIPVPGHHMSFLLFFFLFSPPQAAPVDPEAVAWFQKGEELIGTDQAFSEQQAHFFEKALEMEPDFVPALFNLGLIYLHQGKLDRALEPLSRLVRIEPENDKAYSLRVEAHLRKEDLTSAQADIDRLKQLAPQSPATWQESGRLHYRQARMPEAAADFEKALQLDPDDPDLHLDLATALDQTDRKELATKHYERFLAHFPEDPRANFLLARNLMLREEFERALGYFQTARKLGRAGAEVDQNLAYVLLRLERLDEAETLLMAGEDSVASLFNLGSIAIEEGRLVDAELYLRRAALRDPTNITIWITLGDLFEEAGRNMEAGRAYQKAVQLGAADFDTLLRLGIAQANTEQSEAARSTLERALKINSESPEAPFFLGLVYERLKEEERALSSYEKALENGEDNARLHFRVGVLYSKRNKVSESIEHFSRSLELEAVKYLPIIQQELLNVTSDLDAVRYETRFAELLKKHDPLR